ncbi:hypothetical protein [Paenibacillus oleatilyticus]|uniref:hypothetical protein n=1 Tax=Paenibacillus oleatilyticus TaxID=2594886 RepID=UPI001C1FAB8B|nr:hypothetical protein [Paenibacillus oleatilyticus]MBU7320832.1 hypothetical protein [Paenibacillus oleatilyticus]
MRKLGLCCLMAAMTISITACGKSEPASTSPAPITQSEPKKEHEQKAPVPQKEPEQKVPDWKSSIDEIAKSDKTPTEKFDEVTILARKYKPDDKELKEFEAYIINEYKNKKYLNDITNHSYMLSNIFRATVVERHYNDKEKKPIDSFSFDFIQNSKYTYRGVDKVDSESVKSNEKQMDKALKQIK